MLKVDVRGWEEERPTFRPTAEEVSDAMQAETKAGRGGRNQLLLGLLRWRATSDVMLSPCASSWLNLARRPVGLSRDCVLTAVRSKETCRMES